MTPKYIEIVLACSEIDNGIVSLVVENDRPDTKEEIAHFFNGFMPKEMFWPSEYEMPNVLEVLGKDTDHEPMVRLKQVNCAYAENIELSPTQHMVDVKYSDIYHAGCTPTAILNC